MVPVAPVPRRGLDGIVSAMKLVVGLGLLGPWLGCDSEATWTNRKAT